jgi:hypothetical protein
MPLATPAPRLAVLAAANPAANDPPTPCPLGNYFLLFIRLSIPGLTFIFIGFALEKIDFC